MTTARHRTVSAPVVWRETPIGHFVAPDAHGDFGVAARLVLHTAALAAGRLLDLARRAREMPARSRSELLAELLMSDTAINEDLLERARQLAIPIAGWHVAVRIEADDLDESGRDEVQRFELLESAGQVALQAAAAHRRHLVPVPDRPRHRAGPGHDVQPGPAGRRPGGPVGRARAAGDQRPAAGAAVPGRGGRAARGPDGAARLGRRGPGRAARRAGRAASRPAWPRTTRSGSGGC